MSEFVFLFRSDEQGYREAMSTPERGDLTQAVSLASGCPIVEGGGSVEIRPVMKGQV